MTTEVPPAVVPLVVTRLVTWGTSTGLVKINWSAVVVAEVPALDTTVTSTVPGLWLGLTAVICVELTTEKEAAAVVPNMTFETFVKFVPVIVTDVPPEPVPVPALSAVTVGAVDANVNWSWAESTGDDPAEVTTMTSTAPAAWAGATAVMEVEEVAEKELAAVDPNMTAETELKPVPVIVMEVPPAVLPVDGPT